MRGKTRTAGKRRCKGKRKKKLMGAEYRGKERDGQEDDEEKKEGR